MTNETKTEPKKAKTTDNKSNELAHTVRDGAIAANIWKRQSQTGFPYYEYSLSRSYKSVSSGKSGYTSNFFARNEAALLNVIQQASRWIADAEAKESTDKDEALAA